MEDEKSKDIQGGGEVTNKEESTVTRLNHRLSAPRQDSNLSDAIITVDNVSFLVHRNLMSCCSPYFRSLFTYANRLDRLASLPDANRPKVNQFQYPGSKTGMASERIKDQGTKAPNSLSAHDKRQEGSSSDCNETSKEELVSSTTSAKGPHSREDITSKPCPRIGKEEKSLDRMNLEPSKGQQQQQHQQHPHDPLRTCQDSQSSSSSSSSVTPVRYPITEVTITNISPCAMSDIIRFAHDGQCALSAENVEELLLAADRFQVTPLIQKCCQFLTKELTIGNCISMVKFASHFPHCDELRVKGTQFLLNNFVEVFQRSPEFNKLTSFELAEILWSDNLNIKREETVLEAIVRWVSSDPEANEESIPTLVSCIRVGLMALDHLKRCVNTWLESNDATTHNKQVTFKVMTEVLSLQRQQMIEVNPAMFAPRIPRDIIIVVGGSNFGFPLNIVEAFDCRSRKWLPIYPHDFAPRSYHGLACLHDDIYVVGGFNGHTYLSSCCKFQPSLMNWEDVTPMNTKRCYVGVCILQDCLYAVGGYDGVYRLKSAERFDVSRNQWSYISPMAHQRSDAGVAVLQDQMYACGGFNGSECVRTVEVYDSVNDQWTPMPNMFHRRSGLGMGVYKACMYAVGGFDGTDCSIRLSVLECYNSHTMQWTVLSPMCHPRSNLAVIILEDLLYAVGGYNGKKTTDVVECYDFSTATWYCSVRLNHNRSALSGCLVSGLPNASSILKRNASDEIYCKLVMPED